MRLESKATLREVGQLVELQKAEKIRDKFQLLKKYKSLPPSEVLEMIKKGS